MTSHRPVVCVFAPVPPPWHGSSYAVQLLLESSFAQSVELVHINTVYAPTVANLGRPAAGKAFRLVQYVGRLVTIARRRRPAVIIITPAFTFLPFLKDSLCILAASWLTDAKIVLWSHSNDTHRLYATAGRLLKRYMAFVVGRAAHVVTVGERLRRNFVPFVGESRVSAISNGLPAIPDHLDTRERECDLRVIYLSNMMRPKGWLRLLQAARRICATHSNIRFSFYGSPGADSPVEEIEREFAKNRFGGRIDYGGPVYGSAKEDVLRAAHVFCLPTDYPTEALPISVLEAMQRGLAIVSTPFGAIEEAVVDGEGGFIVPADDEDALVNALDTLARDRRMVCRMGKFNKRRFSERFSMENVAERWTALISCLEESSKC